jgi:hypothetical protein
MPELKILAVVPIEVSSTPNSDAAEVICKKIRANFI